MALEVEDDVLVGQDFTVNAVVTNKSSTARLVAGVCVCVMVSVVCGDCVVVVCV